MSEQWLAAGSSPVDWCEDNYTVTGNIAEFTNTLSNILFLIIPTSCLGAKVWSSYTKHVSLGTYIQLFFLLFIGVSSAYFHATLSLMGQLLDEVGIIWSLCLGYASYMPDRIRPNFYKGIKAHVISTLLAIAMTAGWFVAPYLNSFVLMTLTIPIITIQLQEITIYRNRDTFKLTVLALIATILAICAWTADRAMCGMWKTMRVPGLHNIWHILIAVGAYLAIMLFSYLKALDEPAVKASIKFLPRGNWGLPYVYCKELLSKDIQ